jgi:hypothetical protein
MMEQQQQRCSKLLLLLLEPCSVYQSAMLAGGVLYDTALALLEVLSDDYLKQAQFNAVIPS